MKFKLLISIALGLIICSNAYSTVCTALSESQGRFYLGPTLLVQDISANQSRFRGLHPRLALGYADISNKYYFAGEFFMIPATLTLSDTKNTGASSAKANSSFGFSLIPGARLYRDIFGYARFGFISSKFSSPNVSKLGGQLGLGLQKEVVTKLIVRGEYIYTAYGQVSRVGTPNSNELGVGFIYLFD